MENASTPPMQNPPMYPYHQRKSRWWIPLVIIGIILIAFLVIVVVILDSFGGLFQTEPVEVKENSVLLINLNSQFSEYRGESLGTLFGEGQIVPFYDLLVAIKKAKTDPKIKGIYLRCSMSQLGWAKRREVVDVLTDFKNSGKFIYAFLEVGNENDYYLALPADSIFLAREGIIEMNGFEVSALFLKGLFDKIGIEYYVQQFEDFKSAGETFSRKNFSDSARLVYQNIIKQTFDNFVDKVSKYRNIPKKEVISVLERGVYSGDSLFALKFVDSLLNDNQVKEFIKKRILGEKYHSDSLKNEIRFVSVASYIRSEGFKSVEKLNPDNVIAIVYAAGPIIQRFQKNPFQMCVIIEPGEFIKNLRKARDDKKVKAIIIRIDSPGGSVIASDEIWEEIRRTKKIKPVYASMSDVAASGGYYIAMACDTIIAHPATLTGSIGVIAIFPNFSGLVNKLGIRVDTISTNESAKELNFFIPFTNRQKEKLEKFSRPVYYRFVSKVAESRRKSFEEARALAKGRVWTGSQAYERGLVDVLGGLNDAISLASKRIGVANPFIKRFPRPADEFQLLLKFLTKRKPDENRTSSLIKLLGAKTSDELLLVLDLIPEQLRQSVLNLLWVSLNANNEKTFAIMPDIISIE